MLRAILLNLLEISRVVIKPTIGRAVWYYQGGKNQHDDGRQPYAATVAYVWNDRLINIGYFNTSGIASSATSVPLIQEGDELPGGAFCMWMPFQVGQAKRHAAVDVAGDPVAGEPVAGAVDAVA